MTYTCDKKKRYGAHSGTKMNMSVLLGVSIAAAITSALPGSKIKSVPCCGFSWRLLPFHLLPGLAKPKLSRGSAECPHFSQIDLMGAVPD